MVIIHSLRAYRTQLAYRLANEPTTCWAVTVVLGYHLLVSPPHPRHTPHPSLPRPQVLGVVSFGVGIWLYLTNNEFATLSEGRDLLGSVFLIAVGFGVIIVGFLGIVAAVWESMVITAVVSCQQATPFE